MPRYAKANQTIEDLKSLIKKVNDPDYGVCPYGILNSDKSSAHEKVREDLSAVKVDFENVEEFGTEDSYSHLPGLENLNGYEMIGFGSSAFPVLWCAGGGDWELPLVFVLYIGQNNELRGYIPEDGNAYNHKKKCAYGSEPNLLNEDYEHIELDDPRYVFNTDKMKADIARKIIIK